MHVTANNPAPRRPKTAEANSVIHAAVPSVDNNSEVLKMRLFRRPTIILGVVILLAFASRALAQTTRSVPDEWGQIVNVVARGLAGETDAQSSLSEVLTGEVPIHRFGSTDPDTVSHMQQTTDGLTVLSARAYVWSAESVASDVTSDLRARAGLPESIRRQFIPRDDSDLKHCNEVAQQWISAVLRPSAGELVGVIVLWEPPPPVTTTSLLLGATAPEIKQPYFVLVKGLRGDDGQFRVTQIAYGDARQALK
jgi:hypothetical protein